MSKSLVPYILVMSILVQFAFAQQNPDSIQGYKEERQHLLTMDSDDPVLVFVNDQRTKISITNPSVDTKRTKVWWGSESGVYDCVAFYRMTISPDGERAAFIGMHKKGKLLVVIDGREIGRYGYIFFDTVVFSPDGQRYAFAVSESGKRGEKDCRVICDGTKGQKFHSIVGICPSFSPNSKHLVYFARERDKWYAVVDEKRGLAFEQTGWGPCFSPDGEQMAYVGVKRDGQYLVVNDTLYGPYPQVRDVTFSPTTNDLVYVAEINDSLILFKNHQRYKQNYKFAHGPVFSNDGTRFAFLASDGVESQYLIVDSVEHRHFPGMYVSTPFFSKGGRHFYYDVGTDKSLAERFFVVDDSIIWRMKGTFNILDVSFSPDGSRFGFVWDIDSTEQRSVIDSTECICKPRCGKFVFSPDSKRYSIVSRLGSETRSKLIVDGEEYTQYEMYYPGQSFTPDGTRIAYVARDHGKSFIVIGQQEMTHYDDIYPLDISFDGDGNLAYFGIEGKDVYRAVIKPLK